MTGFREVTIGNCRLINADCRDVLGGIGPIDAVVTDPPFGIGFAAQPTDYQRLNGMVAKDWDNEAPHDVVADLLNFGKAQIVWGGQYFSLPQRRCWLAWYKPDAPPSMASIELAWTSLDQNSRLIHQSIAATNAERVGHPTQKPLAVMLFSLEQLPDGCDSILDPFMGTGTTAVACIRTDRAFIGIEKDPQYFEKAVARIERAWQLKCSELPFEAPVPPRQLDLLMGCDQ